MQCLLGAYFKYVMMISEGLVGSNLEIYALDTIPNISALDCLL